MREGFRNDPKVSEQVLNEYKHVYDMFDEKMKELTPAIECAITETTPKQRDVEAFVDMPIEECQKFVEGLWDAYIDYEEAAAFYQAMQIKLKNLNINRIYSE